MLISLDSKHIGAWCNGSIHALGACSSGSNPGAPTNLNGLQAVFNLSGRKNAIKHF